MYTHLRKQKFSNAYIDYSSGQDGVFGIDKQLVTTADSFQQMHEEHAVQSKSLPSSSKKKANSRLK